MKVSPTRNDVKLSCSAITDSLLPLFDGTTLRWGLCAFFARRYGWRVTTKTYQTICRAVTFRFSANVSRRSGNVYFQLLVKVSSPRSF